MGDHRAIASRVTIGTVGCDGGGFAAYPRISGSGIVPRREVIAAMLANLLARAHSLVVRDDKGQGLAEYALILALIAIVAILALIFLGNQISDKLSIVGNAM